MTAYDAEAHQDIRLLQAGYNKERKLVCVKNISALSLRLEMNMPKLREMLRLCLT